MGVSSRRSSDSPSWAERTEATRDSVATAVARDRLKLNDRYMRAKPVYISEIINFSSALTERIALNRYSYPYKYYNYSLPKSIHSDRRHMYWV